MKNVAVIGLGTMGSRIALRILAAGYRLAVYNRDRGKAAALQRDGARIAETPADAASGADAIISVVGDDESSRAVWFGAHGAIDAAPKGCTLIECSTLSVGWIGELAGVAAARGLRFVDAGLGGGPSAVDSGSLNLFVGAEKPAFDDVRPLLAAFSREQFRFGGPGAGMAYKLVNNMMVAAQVAALAEGIACAERAGLDMAEVRKAVAAGNLASPMIVTALPNLVARRYEPVTFKLRWMLKDSEYLHRFAESRGMELGIAEASRKLLKGAADRGFGDRNWTAIAEMYRKETP